MTTPSQKCGVAKRFAIELHRNAQRDLEQEDAAWRLAHGNAPSKLDLDLAQASEALAAHPYLGPRISTTRRLRKLLLRNTGYFLVYEVLPRKRIVRIVGLMHKGHLGPRR